MSTITVVVDGDDIVTAWGVSVANALNAIYDNGWLPFAYPPSLDANSASSASTSLIVAAAGVAGSLLQPILVTAPMRVQSLTIRQGATANLRTAEFALYQDTGSTTLARISGTQGTFSFTPSAADDRTANIGTPGTLLAPGIVWLDIRNTSAAQTFPVRHGADPTEAAGDMAMVNNSVGAAVLGSTVDAATDWSAVAHTFFVRLNGRVMGASSAF